MPNRVLALDLTKLYDSSLNEEDQKKKSDLIVKYHRVDDNNNSTKNRGKINPKDGSKYTISPRNHEIELSCTERISRQRHSSRGNQRIYPNSARQKEPLVVDSGPSFISYFPTKIPQSAAMDPLIDNSPATGPLKILEERANRETKIPTLAKVDILPALGGYELEYSDSVDDPESQRRHRHHNNRNSQIKNQSMLSMMSSLSDTSSVGQLYPPFGEFGDLEEKSQFEVPRKKKTADAPVLRNDREWKKKEELLLNREFKDFQLVKQLAGGASIMKGVSYQRGVKGSNISQRYQANLEKIMFIRNVYEHRDFRDTFPRETKKSVKKTQLGLQYQLRNGVTPATAGHDVANHYSFVRGSPEDKDLINANLHVAAVHGDRPTVHVPMFVSPVTTALPATSPRQEVNNILHQQRDAPNHLRTSPTSANNHNRNHTTPASTPMAGETVSSPAPSSSKPRNPSFRTQKMMKQHQMPIASVDSMSMQTNPHALESELGSLPLPEHSDTSQPLASMATSQEQFNNAPSFQNPGVSTISGWAPNVPKASELLPEAFNLDPTVHVDADSHLVAQRMPQYKLDDGSMTTGVTTTMLLLNGLVQHQQQQQQHALSQQHYFQHQQAQPPPSSATVSTAQSMTTARRYASPPAASAAALRSMAGMEGLELMSTTAGTVLSSPATPRSMLVGPVGSNIIISPTSSVDVTTAVFAQGIQHHQAFLSSQMRRMKHDSKRLQQKNMLVFDDPRQDVLSGQPIPQPAFYPKPLVQDTMCPDVSHLISTGHHLSVGHTDHADPTTTISQEPPSSAPKHPSTSPKSPKIQLMLTMAHHRQKSPQPHHVHHTADEDQQLQQMSADPSLHEEEEFSHPDTNLIAMGVHLPLSSRPTTTTVSHPTRPVSPPVHHQSAHDTSSETPVIESTVVEQHHTAGDGEGPEDNNPDPDHNLPEDADKKNEEREEEEEEENDQRNIDVQEDEVLYLHEEDHSNGDVLETHHVTDAIHESSSSSEPET